MRNEQELSFSLTTIQFFFVVVVKYIYIKNMFALVTLPFRFFSCTFFHPGHFSNGVQHSVLNCTNTDVHRKKNIYMKYMKHESMHCHHRQQRLSSSGIPIEREKTISQLKWATYYQRFVSNEMTSCFSLDKIHTLGPIFLSLLLLSHSIFCFFLFTILL